MDVVVRTDRRASGGFSFGYCRLVDGRSVENSFHARQPQRPIRNSDHPDMSILRLSARIRIVKHCRGRERKVTAAAGEFLKAPASPRRPGGQTHFDDDFVRFERGGERTLEEV